MIRTESRTETKPLFRRAKRPFEQLRLFFQRLQWKLTLAYTLFTVITIVIMVGAAVAFFWYSTFWSNSLPGRLAEGLDRATPRLQTYFNQRPIDQAGLERWVNSVVVEGDLIIPIPRDNAKDENDTISANFGKPMLLALLDQQGQILAAYSTGELDRQAVLAPQLPPESQAMVQAALAGETEYDTLSTRAAAGELVAAAPIFNNDAQVAGVIFLVSMLPFEAGEFIQLYFQNTILPAAVAMLIAGVIAGVLFGYLISRGLTRRIKVLSQVTDDWSRGNFGTLALDPSGDELGLLARHMNHMAIQLQNLLQTRQEFATLEERNRLARDLHDSVKQQVFATAMQVGAAKALINQNSDLAKTHILEAEQLIRQAQQELTALIKELRPAALEGKGLVNALRDYTADWSRQAGIEAEVRVSGERPLPLSLEQSLFRLAQEALANAARHSQATKVDISLTWEDDSLTLSISDNGQGFNSTTAQRIGVGLKSMRERIEAVGGCLRVESQPDRGTRIIAQIDNIA